MEKYKFMKLKISGRYFIYNEEVEFFEYRNTREEAKDLRDKMNRDAKVSNDEVKA